MSDIYSLPQVEAEIYSYYQWFHLENPAVAPQETGTLAALWALFDRLIINE